MYDRQPSIHPAEIQARQGPISVLEPLLLLQGHESAKSGWTSFYVGRYLPPEATYSSDMSIRYAAVMAARIAFLNSGCPLSA